LDLNTESEFLSNVLRSIFGFAMIMSPNIEKIIRISNGW